MKKILIKGDSNENNKFEDNFNNDYETAKLINFISDKINKNPKIKNMIRAGFFIFLILFNIFFIQTNEKADFFKAI